MIQISLRIRTVCSDSSLNAFRIAKKTHIFYACNEDLSDFTDEQTDLSLRWTHISKGTFTDVSAQL